MEYLKSILVWMHVMGMVGAFGSLVVVQFGLPQDVRDSAAGARVGPRLTSWMLAVGTLAGLAVLGLTAMQMHSAGSSLSAMGMHYLGVIGTKVILLLATGACVGISATKLRAGLVQTSIKLRITAILALALAALFGVSLTHF